MCCRARDESVDKICVQQYKAYYPKKKILSTYIGRPSIIRASGCVMSFEFLTIDFLVYAVFSCEEDKQMLKAR